DGAVAKRNILGAGEAATCGYIEVDIEIGHERFRPCLGSHQSEAKKRRANYRRTQLHVSNGPGLPGQSGMGGLTHAHALPAVTDMRTARCHLVQSVTVAVTVSV